MFNYATVRKFRHGDNPARWTGYLSELLARPYSIAPVQHHPALDYKKIGEFMVALREREGIGALALEFTVLACARTGETLGRRGAKSTSTKRYGSFQRKDQGR